MKKALYLVLGGILYLSACQERPAHENILTEVNGEFDFPDSLSARRISFALALRDSIAESTWDDFNTKRVEGPFIYFNDNVSEIFFHDSLIREKVRELDIYSADYAISPRTDSIPFHFEVMISFDPSDSGQFYFNNPVEQFLRVEEVANYIPSVSSTEFWATMVIHEMFHQYQYNQPSYRSYGRSQIGSLPFDSRDLVRLCRDDENFLPMIQRENDLLMEAIQASDERVKVDLIINYLDNRSRRIEQYGQENEHLEQVENYYIIQEGSARYMEFQCMNVLNELARNPELLLVEKDSSFLSYSEFQNLDLDGEAFNFLTYAGPSDYHYTLGFNLMRLMDQLGIEYKETLLEEPETAMHEYLEAYLSTWSAEE